MIILEKEIINNDKELLLIGSSLSVTSPILIIGVFHGDEPQGEEIINQYIKEVNNSNLIFIPCLNPYGKEKQTRLNNNEVDLNRNFPTKNWILSEKDNYYGGKTPASEAETQFVIKILQKYKPKMILTLHTPYKIVNYDGPAENIANKISEIINYPVEKNIGYPTPGSFGTYAGVERKIPVITLEMDEEEEIRLLCSKVKKVFDFLENY